MSANQRIIDDGDVRAASSQDPADAGRHSGSGRSRDEIADHHSPTAGSGTAAVARGDDLRQVGDHYR